MYVYLRYLKLFWRISRTRDLVRVLKAKVFTSSVYQQTNFKKYFGLRLESFLVSAFRVKTLQHARALVRNGHVFVNGVRVLNEGISLKRLDVVTFSTRALVWLRLLRRIRRNRKVRKFDRRIVNRRGSASVIYGPRLSHAVVWNTSASVRELANCRQLPVFGANEQKHLSVTLRTLSR